MLTKFLCTFIFIGVWTSCSVMRKYKTPKGAIIQESTIYNIYYFLKIQHFRGFHYCFKHLILFFYLVNPQSYSISDEIMLNYFHYRYNWIIMALTYFIPVVLIAVSSTHMGYILWCKQPIGIITAPIERARKKKKKVS